MSEISTEQRLRLVHQIRQEHNQNRQTIQSRERIVYGKDITAQDPFIQRQNYRNSLTEEFTNNYSSNADSFPVKQSTFGMRMLIAALLFVGYFFLESSKINLGALDAEVIQTEVNRYSGAEINLFDFMDNITYTFNND